MMKISRLPSWLALCVVSSLGLALLVSRARAANAPVIAKNNADSPVTVTDNGNSWTLDNGIVKVTVNKNSGNFRSLVYKGMETMSAGGAWEQTPGAAAQVGGLSQSITIDPTKNNGN